MEAYTGTRQDLPDPYPRGKLRKSVDTYSELTS
jgi:hypothetical protein